MAGDSPAAALVWCPFPDIDSARAIAATLLDEGLIACANILGPVEAHFVWEGERSSAAEIAVLFKTTTDRLEQCVARLGVLHPYDTPAVTGWRCDAALPATMAWLAATTQGAGVAENGAAG